MNADTRLALFNRTYDVLNKGNCPIENAAKKLHEKTLDLRSLGFAGGYLRVPSMNDSLEVEVLYPA